MKAVVIRDVRETGFAELPEPVPQEGEVTLRVGHVGLCGSDLNTFLGRNPLAQLPLIPGHEVSGTIIARGANVPDEYAIGAKAIVIPYIACGDCSACKANRRNACRNNKTLGVQREGGMVEQLVVATDSIILNDRLSSRFRALVEPLSVGFHAVRRGCAKADETVVVIGGGMIGVGAIIGAVRRGARVIVIEVSESKRDILLGLGVECVLNPEQVDAAAEIARLTAGEGANLVIEAVGLPATFQAAIDYACYAGRVVYLGYSKEHVSYDTKYFNLKELNILGSRNANREDFDRVIEYLEDNANEAEVLISKVFDWSDADGAFEYWDSVRSTVFKIMVEVGDD
ncbi:MAG: alcohol dehydrogenase catalytic domain-containing protein [Sphingomonadales bacterium]|nr:alcohol dehydrogenase catalytic domain-containing protein [Sphingomonadales bacterium]